MLGLVVTLLLQRMLIKKSTELRIISEVFSSPYSGPDDVGAAAISIMQLVYSGSTNQSLTKLRYVMKFH